MKIILCITALLGATAVALGAFGAHGLEGKLTTAQLEVWNTAVKYQLIHILLILILLLSKYQEQFIMPAIFLLVGIVLFSGSLYLLSAKDLLNIGSFAKILGPITPLGGLSFIVGWVLLAYRFFRLF